MPNLDDIIIVLGVDGVQTVFVEQIRSKLH